MKTKFLLIPTIALLLAACGGRPTTSSEAPSSQAPSSMAPASSEAPSSEAPASSETPESSQAPASSELPSSEAPSSIEPASSVAPASSELPPSSEAPSSSQSSQIRKDFWIRVYLDYNHFDESNPILKIMWQYGLPFTKEDIGLTDPTSVPDPYYNRFLGWSLHTIVDETQYLWRFGEDVVTAEMAVGGYINLYGIFVRE